MLKPCMKLATAFLSILLGAQAFGQFVPVTAQVTKSHVVIRDGKVVEQHVQEGKYYRSANGSEIYEWVNKDGQPIDEGSLRDNATGKNYHLDFLQHVALEGRQDQPLPPDALSAKKAENRPTDVVEGVTCAVYSPQVLDPKGKLTGDTLRNCISPDYFLRLWEDGRSQSQSDPGIMYQSKMQLHRITLHAEIDPSFFDVDHRFRVSATQH